MGLKMKAEIEYFLLRVVLKMISNDFGFIYLVLLMTDMMPILWLSICDFGVNYLISMPQWFEMLTLKVHFCFLFQCRWNVFIL